MVILGTCIDQRATRDGSIDLLRVTCVMQLYVNLAIALSESDQDDQLVLQLYDGYIISMGLAKLGQWASTAALC